MTTASQYEIYGFDDIHDGSSMAMPYNGGDSVEKHSSQQPTQLIYRGILTRPSTRPRRFMA